MMRLAEICPGKWVNPQEVAAVIIRAPEDQDSEKWNVWLFPQARA